MSVPQDSLIKLLAGGGGTNAAPGANPMSAAAPGNQPPAGGPMATPQPKEGVTQAGLVQVSLALNALEQALPAFGSATEEGKAVLSALKTLSGKFGRQRQESDKLVPAELMQLVQGAGPAAKSLGGLPPTQPAMPTA